MYNFKLIQPLFFQIFIFIQNTNYQLSKFFLDNSIVFSMHKICVT